ncbi:MAG: sulfite exporter TauE/SafE family protein [Aigarchaeota archaeon]|nr:sulfite exporter TauE/SafE family protein [Candidatus Pelearchaeum maunauluense]
MPVNIIMVFILAAASASLGALIGAGGGFIFVPIMLYLGYPPQQAVSTSLVMVFFNALSSSSVYYRQKRLNLTRAASLGVLTLPGAVIGGYTLTYLNPGTFKLIFGAFLASAALYMVVRSGHRSSTVFRADEMDRAPRIKLGYPLAAASGFVSSMFGVGGGILLVPAFIHIINLPTHIATATSQFITAFASGFGFTTITSLGGADVALLPAAALAGVAGVQAGARISKRVRARIIEIIAGLALFTVAVNLIAGSLTA